MKVDIYIREKNGTREIRVPILPEKIPFPGGDAMFITHEIMNLGEVAIPSGTELAPYSWESVFPGELRKNDPMIRGSWIAPKTYDSILNDWKKKGTKLNLIVLGYPINADVYIKEYHPTASGPFGDIEYEISFVEARDIVITTSKVEQTTTKRPATTSATYIIKKGDTLWGIAKKFYGTGTKWKTIYNANKEIIEKTAKARGFKSSDNGHWIFPGVKLTIPGVSGSSGTGKKSASGSSSKGSSGSSDKKSSSSTEKSKAYLTQRSEGIASLVSVIKQDKNKSATMTDFK